MNEQDSSAGQVESTPSTTPYKDRSTGLVVFGVLTILLGCLSGLFVPLMLFGQAMAVKTNKMPGNFSAILPAIFIYGGLAVALIWLGIGSTMARRWARALLPIFSWSWLGIGLLTMASMAFIMPKVLANAPSMNAAAMGGIVVGIFLVDGFLFIVLPAIWTYFYGSRRVKATCVARNPVICWTDACPLPVLGLCLWLVFSVIGMLVLSFAKFGATPFFGMFLTGVPETIFYLATAALWGYAAWLLYHLDERGWWLTLIVACVFSVSGILTFARHDILEMYRLMNYSEAQIQQIQKSGLLVGNNMIGMMVFSMVPFLGYILFIKKYFGRKA